MADIFISYSRKDTVFARRLFDALAETERDTWADWEGIPYSVDWWQEICRGIDAAEAVVFIISPDSLTSRICNREVEYARQNNKRIVPVVYREVDEKQVAGEWFEQEWEAAARENWGSLKKLNWLFFRDADNFDHSFSELVKAVEQDPEQLRTHTRLLVKAREWASNTESDAGLLRGSELRDADNWLRFSGVKTPSPTELHIAYIQASLKKQAEEQTQELRRQLQQQRLQRGLLFVMTVLLVAVTGIGLLLFRLTNQTQVAQSAQQLGSLLLTANARDAFSGLEYEKALDQAIQANSFDNPPFEAQSMLSEIVYSFRPFKDTNPALISTYPTNDNLFSCVTVDSRGQMIAAGTRSGQIELRDFDNPGPVRVLEGQIASITAVTFSPDGQYVASGSWSRHIILYNTSTGEVVRTLDGHYGPVTAVAFSPDGQLLVSGSRDHTLILWHVATGQAIFRMQAQQGGITDVAFSPNGQYFLSSSRDGSIVIWEVVSGQPRYRFSGHSAQVNSIAFSPDGETFVSASDDQSVALWDVQSGLEIRRMTGQRGTITDAVFSPDGASILSASSDHTMILWDTATGRPTRQYSTDSYYWITQMSFARDGQRLLTVSNQGDMYLWRVDTLPKLLALANSILPELKAQESPTGSG
jgi:WD40 repeat protein